MLNLTNVKDMINSVGFPIFISCVLIYLNTQIINTQNQLIQELEKSVISTSHETATNRVAIQENSKLILTLISQVETECN